ncbi:IclR family transcriptional regulator [Asanoa ishikariensis]|uniref:Transcriptional regulator, IclR family n=1 Tax=Asanoa ishikariensis TaxID=137265 RepID=A0A1H3LRJ7_9ACTN|nr:IclR family transcriptional regulator [Asanoa ishikariensis]GIF65625.1 IclR family transcriptional regulator [Asanoa ishikariensis]SDY66588.1 transcriptional regulator, IclR family [Asanoa ishikariensis]
MPRATRISVDDAKPASANYHANALARGLALLEMLAAAPDPLTLTEFSDATALPKSTLVRLLAVLSEMEYLVRVDDRPSYRLGHKVQRLAAAYVSNLDLTVVAERYLQPVAEQTGQTANLGVLDGDQVLHICVAEPDRPLRFTSSLGARDHTYATGLGKVLLSALPDDQVAAAVPAEPFAAFTDSTMTTLADLRKDLKKVARRGFALDDSERSVGLRCVAVPVRIDGDCLAAISVSGPSGEFSTAKQQVYVAALDEAAKAVTDDPDFVTALRIVHRSLRVAGRP